MAEVIITSETSSESYSAAVWDPQTGSLLHAYKNASALGHHTLQILSNNYLIAADVTKSRLFIWELNSQSPVANLTLISPGKVSALCCTSDSRYLAAAVGEKIFIWFTRTGRLLRTISRHYQTITCLQFSSDRSMLFSGSEDGLVFGWRLAAVINNEDPAPQHQFSNHTMAVKDIDISPAGPGALIVTVSLDCTARIYSLNTGALLLTLVFNVPLTSVCLSMAYRSLFIGCSNGTIRQFDLGQPPRGIEHHVADEQGLVFRGHSGPVTNLSVSLSGANLLSGSSDGSVKLWDVPSRQITRNFPHKTPITSAMFSLRTGAVSKKMTIHPLRRVMEDNVEEILEIFVKDKENSTFDDLFGGEEANEGVVRELNEALSTISLLKSKMRKLFEIKVSGLMKK